jgi:hypothetical protein
LIFHYPSEDGHYHIVVFLPLAFFSTLLFEEVSLFGPDVDGLHDD